MKKKYLLIIVFSFLSGLSFAQQKKGNSIPQRIFLNLTDKPANSIAINWRTLEKVKSLKLKLQKLQIGQDLIQWLILLQQ